MTSSMGSTAIRLRPASRRASRFFCARGQKIRSRTPVKLGTMSISRAAPGRCTPPPRPPPPIYYGATSPESPAMVARRGWNLALSRQPLANCARAIKSYRDERAKLGNLAGGGDAIMARDVYVAETDEQAWKEAGPEVTRFWQLATDNVWR